MQYNFEWNPVKARENLKKHKVTFEQATAVFKDPLAITVYDRSESTDNEDRWATLGQVEGVHYLVVVHTDFDKQGDAATIRIISARSATKHEIKQYEQG